MDIGGWKTREMFKRYAITDSKDIAAAIAKRELAQTENAIAAINPNSAALRNSSFPLSVFVPLFMTGSFSGRCGGSNDNYHLNPATGVSCHPLISGCPRRRTV